MSGSEGPNRDRWDVIVVGGGQAGETAAQYASQFSGLSTVLVEEDLIGGECEYWACRPSKALLLPVEAQSQGRDLPGVREMIAGRSLDVPAVLRRRDDIAFHYGDSQEVDFLKANGIDLVRGRGRLAGERTVAVTGSDGDVRTLTAEHAVVLATGSSAYVPPTDGLADAFPWTSRDVTALREVPRWVVVIGGGAVACESVTWLRALGAEATLVHRGPTLLKTMEPFARDFAARHLAEAGITVLLDTNVTRVKRPDAENSGVGRLHGGPVTVTLDNGDQVEADELVVAVGRRGGTDDIGLETVGVAAPHGYLDVDDQLTVVGTDWLYATGDLTGRALLTHMAKYQARIAGDAITARAAGGSGTGALTTAEYDAVPQVVFLDPPMSQVGLTEADARSRGIDVETAEFDIAAVSGAAISREHYDGRAKLIVNRATDTLVGATFAGSGTTELLHSATIAIVGQVPVSRLWHAVPSFPTVSEIWLKLLETLRQRRRQP
ncbi:dihydrolipoamide dehydrogenase [Asanoa hainanensis]|uniref:Dihydrolipoamide dehydrogenase n=1 Tax=Asanoa hainanensis TaxID=560556 RepID=A0A239PHZ7_9ACTN|nr:NAD(P)/FAD-dependent oxidoreductase [Asanoa hainanensis]SNT66228.1 dihydrolipoamide dehydrogenase [Asanoa hainanensis]